MGWMSNKRESVCVEGTISLTALLAWSRNVKYNTKSDIWALGVMLYEMCALHVPFDAANFRELRKKIVYTHPSPLSPHFSRALRELVADMLVCWNGRAPQKKQHTSSSPVLPVCGR